MRSDWGTDLMECVWTHPSLPLHSRPPPDWLQKMIKEAESNKQIRAFMERNKLNVSRFYTNVKFDCWMILFAPSQNQAFGVQMEPRDRMVSAEFIVLVFSRDRIRSYLLKHFTRKVRIKVNRRFDLNLENDVWYIETSFNHYFNFSYFLTYM